MPDLILHHYLTSPFSEKVRRILAYKRLPYRSVFIPPIVPKRDYVALTGGYRRTPSLQIGADIYCDTALICDVLEELHPMPALLPAAQESLIRTIAQWADSSLFWASMAYARSPEAFAEMFDGVPDFVRYAFIADRKAMFVNMPKIDAADGEAAYSVYLTRLAQMLGDQAFVCGSEPTLADFACYHPLWYTQTRTPSRIAIWADKPAITSWMARMADLGNGDPQAITADEAIQIAAKSDPIEVHPGDAPGLTAPRLGSTVRVTPESFGTEHSSGELVALLANRITLRRTDARAGMVQVHFPRLGYVLQQDETAEA
ncbi:glutathione S-transferase family protein [Roseateles sp. NT4]|uniref:glutathione S-transferase family protein n=1 Tax=Roseateles sp. NT4 TaxID=3453715 RepID=UPI003EE92184